MTHGQVKTIPKKDWFTRGYAWKPSFLRTKTPVFHGKMRLPEATPHRPFTGDLEE